MKKGLLAAILAALIILLGAWALADEDKLVVTVNGQAPAGVIEVDISRVSTLKLEANMPVKSYRRSSSSRCDIAPDGTLTVKKTGGFTITVTAENGQKAAVKFKAVKKATAINVTGNSHELAAGKKLSLKASVQPSGVNNRKVTWTSSDPSAATVDARGRVTAQKVSERKSVVITATAQDGSGVVGSYDLTITPVASGVKLYLDGEIVNGKTLYVDVNAVNALRLTAEVEPAGASQSVKWTSSSRGRATVTGGNVAIKKRGNVTITAVAEDGSRVSARVVLKIAAISKTVNVGGVSTLPAGKTARLTAQVLPRDTTDNKVTWSSSNPAVLSVDSRGRIRAGQVTSATTVTITATARDGGAVGKRTIIVTPRAMSVRVTRNGAAIPNVVFIDSGTMTPVKLGASVYPADAAQNVTWKSGNTRVVRVDNNGVLTPVKKGKTIVTASANDGTGVKRTFYVAVGDFSQLPYYIEVDKTNQVVRVYERGDGTYTHLIRRMVCSTGRIDSKLPDKLYEMSGARLKWCRAADGHLYMQYATRIYSSYMFHGVPTDGVGGSRVKADYYRKLGERASGGCIRMLCADAKWIFDNVPNGSFVLVMKGARNPAEYGSVTVPAANQTGSLIWDPTDDNPANPYYNADYTSEVE
ncbi:MAG: Ig-like domain-containing protein [Clostridiales bacterium]|nr:Ig-like domain-containing protein [Clostridiales bacterium]